MLLELTVAEQRFNAVMEVLRDGLTVIEVADRYGVSRQAVHGWLRRWKAGGLDALADRSHRPNTCPHQMSAEVEARLCELRRRHPHWGQRRLAHELARDGIDSPPGLTSIYRALVPNGLIQPRSRRRAKADYRRWERARPMELWQLDVSQRTLRRRVREVASWRRPRLVAKGDPDRDQVLAELRHTIAELPDGAVVLAEDETHVNLLPWIRSTWIANGCRQQVMIPGTNRRRTIFGAVDLHTGRFLTRSPTRPSAPTSPGSASSSWPPTRPHRWSQ